MTPAAPTASTTRTAPLKVAVIGGGVLGSATARALALRGADVTLYERVALGAGTTGTTFAWINSHAKNPLSYHRLNAAGVAEHHALHRAGDRAPQWFFPGGNLEWAADEAGAERLRAALDTLTERGYPWRWITPGEAVAAAPDLRVPAHVRDIACFPEEAYVLPHPLVARLWGEAREHGARLCCPAEVTGIERIEGLGGAPRGVRVQLADGTEESADVVVSATGRWSAATTALAGTPLPMADPDAPGSATVGLLGYTGPTAARLSAVLTTPGLNVRPDGGGRLVVQGLDLGEDDADPGNPPATDGPLAEELLARLERLLHGTEGARLESLRVGQRPLPADGLTAAGWLGGDRDGNGPGSRVYVLATHSGMTLGPLLGRLAAAEIVDGERDGLLEDFSPDRLTGADQDELARRAAQLERPKFAGQQ